MASKKKNGENRSAGSHATPRSIRDLEGDPGDRSEKGRPRDKLPRGGENDTQGSTVRRLKAER